MRDFESNFQLSDGVRLVFDTASSSRRHFFGYYDKSPLDASGTRLLCHVVEHDGRLVDETDTAEIGYWDLPTGQYHRIAETRAFNWQQGSMLQWLGPDYGRRIVFNDRRSDRYAAVIVDLASGQQQELPRTIYSVHPNGRDAVTPIFERHEFCRPGYSYLGVRDQRWDADAPSGDGVYSLDLETGDSRCLISVAELMSRCPVHSCRDVPNYVEHMMFNPDGSRFAFFHRWRLSDGAAYTRLHTCDADGDNLYSFPDSGMYSHLCWRNNTEFVITGRPASMVSRLRVSAGMLKTLVRPALRAFRRLSNWEAAQWTRQKLMSDGYLHFQDQSTSCSVIGKGELTEDGHPGFRPGDQDWMLTDTYPDSNLMQQVIACHVPTGRLVTLGHFRSLEGYANTGHRCDLHPRWDHGGQFVIIDSLCSGKRQLYVLDVQQALATALGGNVHLAA